MKSYDLGGQFARGFSTVGQFSRNVRFTLSRFGSDLVRRSKNDSTSAGNSGSSRRPEPTPNENSKRPDYVFDPNAEHKADVQIFDGLISLGDLSCGLGERSIARAISFCNVRYVLLWAGSF